MLNVRMEGLHGIKNLGSVVLAWEDLIRLQFGNIVFLKSP